MSRVSVAENRTRHVVRGVHGAGGEVGEERLVRASDF